MLKRQLAFAGVGGRFQPPSGGCVLKLITLLLPLLGRRPAAFRRLCVETGLPMAAAQVVVAPAAFRRLCVETLNRQTSLYLAFPAAFRRLCVETMLGLSAPVHAEASRLQAAVC